MKSRTGHRCEEKANAESRPLWLRNDVCTVQSHLAGDLVARGLGGLSWRRSRLGMAALGQRGPALSCATLGLRWAALGFCTRAPPPPVSKAT
jgi:hypothetical protein